jgi:hypothetical protein
MSYRKRWTLVSWTWAWTSQIGDQSWYSERSGFGHWEVLGEVDEIFLRSISVGPVLCLVYEHLHMGRTDRLYCPRFHM